MLMAYAILRRLWAHDEPSIRAPNTLTYTGRPTSKHDLMVRQRVPDAALSVLRLPTFRTICQHITNQRLQRTNTLFANERFRDACPFPRLLYVQPLSFSFSTYISEVSIQSPADSRSHSAHAPLINPYRWHLRLRTHPHGNHGGWTTIFSALLQVGP